MSSDLHSQSPQFLHQSPHFRAGGTQFLGDLGPTDNDGRIADKQANDAPQAGIRLLVHRILRSAACSSNLNAGIIDSVVAPQSPVFSMQGLTLERSINLRGVED